MSNTVPISGLPAASSVNDADIVPIVQGGVTKQATAAQISILPVSASIPYVGKSQQFVFVGDSITYGLTSPNTVSYPQAMAGMPPCEGGGTFTNYGVPGWSLSDLVAGYSSGPYTKRPAATGSSRCVLFVWIGANDYPNSVDPSTWMASLESYWTTAQSDGFVVVAFTIMDRTGSNNQSYTKNILRQELNRSICERAKANGIPVVDTDALLSLYVADTSIFIDGSHPTDLGNKIIAHEVSRVLSQQGSQIVPTYRPVAAGPVFSLSQGANAILEAASIAAQSSGVISTALHPATTAIGTGDFTFTAWVKPSSSAALGTLYILSDGGGGTTGFGLLNGGSGPSGVFILPGTNYSSSWATPDVWNHIAATRSGTTLKYYINGSLVTTTTNSNSLNALTSCIDSTGSIARVRAYSRALSSAEISDDFNRLSPFKSSESSYIFAMAESGSGFQFPDASDAGCHILLDVAQAAKIVYPKKIGEFRWTTVGNEWIAGRQVLPANARIIGYTIRCHVGGVTVDISTANGTGTVVHNRTMIAGITELCPNIPFTSTGSIFCNASGETIDHTILYEILDLPITGSALTYDKMTRVVLFGTATADVPSISGNATTDVFVTVPGATPGDTVSIGIGSDLANNGQLKPHAWVYATDTVVVRFSNPPGAAASSATTGSVVNVHVTKVS